MTLALLLTIALSLTIGIAAGYYLIVGILNVLSPNRTASAAVEASRLLVETPR